MNLHTVLGRAWPDRPAPAVGSPRGLARDPVLRGLAAVLVVILVVHAGRLGDLDLRRGCSGWSRSCSTSATPC